MKNIRGFLSKNFQFLEVNFSIYLNRRVLGSQMELFNFSASMVSHKGFTCVQY